jgi:hypothetical protein
MFILHYFLLTGERTFGVLTKLDLMDKGTNALDVKIFPCSSFVYPETVFVYTLVTDKFCK